MRKIAIMGATGSIGLAALDVLRKQRDYQVIALAGKNNVDGLLPLIEEFLPPYAVLFEEAAAKKLQMTLAHRKVPCQVLSGEEGLKTIATLPDTDWVLAAISGSAGLLSTYEAAKAGKKILLANKESLVMAGPLFKAVCEASGAKLFPIDSEHNAILQLLPKGLDSPLQEQGVRKIILTASGGPFLEKDMNALRDVTPQEAANHPNWRMGTKISIDSATMMNKGLELIEASWLFGASLEEMAVLVHPQSIVHGLVELIDGSLLCQAAMPDMRIPIAYALSWPNRVDIGLYPLNLANVGRLDFQSPDLDQFPCLRLAQEALRQGTWACCALNAANEVAVAAFMNGHISFLAIPELIEKTLTRLVPQPLKTIDDVLEIDQKARLCAQGFLA
jgi:1-deoxy-D-xylulose-5-phosphate reductoisomerase